MTSFMMKLFDTSDFVPRWNCGNWTNAHALLHIVSDIAIAGAYAAIPLVLIYFIWRRNDLPFSSVFVLFALFIFSCGSVHLVEATIFWQPWYRFSGLLKLITAIVSWLTVLALIPIVPRALHLPGLAAVNRQLEEEVRERRIAEAELTTAYEELQDFARNVVNREDRIIELKHEVNGLLKQLGQAPRYQFDSAPS